MVKRQDVFLILLILLIAAVLFLGYGFFCRGLGEEVVVYVGEEELARFPLQENTEYQIVSRENGRNELKIYKGQADVTDASCPDKVCVNQHSISHIGETIVCMPNQVIVTVE